MKRCLLTAALVAAVGISLPGCTLLSLIVGERIPPEFDISDYNVLVPAFRDSHQFHYESRRGDAVSEAVARQLREEGDCFLVNDAEIEEGIISGEYADPPPWSDLGLEAGADYVVLGWLRSVKVTDNAVIGTLRGTADVRVELWDTRANRRVHDKTFKVTFPEDINKEVPAVFEVTKQELEKHLLSRVAIRISEIYCGAYVRR